MEIKEYGSIEDAINISIASSNKSRKSIANELWPNSKPGTAHQRLTECLLSSKPRKLNINEIIKIYVILLENPRVEADAINYLCDQLGYERPVKKPPKDVGAEILKSFKELSIKVQQTLEMLQKNANSKQEKEAKKENVVFLEKSKINDDAIEKVI